MPAPSLSLNEHAILEREYFQQLLDALKSKDYQVMGPTIREGAIVYHHLTSVAELPIGYTDEQYERPEQPAVEMQPRAATGYACTEAPRGTLYHRYRLDEQGLIQEAKIVPPTSQNQKTIENDLRQMIPLAITLPEEQLTWRCEQAIRNYDPCISCATHFLKLAIEREESK